MNEFDEIAQELSKIQGVIDNSETVTENSLALFQSSLSILRARINTFVAIRKKFEDDILTMEGTIKFAREKKKCFEDYLATWDAKATEPMSRNPDVQFCNETHELTILHSSGIVIEDLKKIPPEFLIAVTEYRPDKRKIKEAIDRGQEVPGAILEHRKNLKVVERV